jgi:hypothetical protein
MNIKAIFIIFAIALAAVHASDEPAHMTKRRLQVERLQQMHKITDKHIARRTQSSSWRPLKIFFDTTSIEADLRTNGMSDRVQFYKKVFENTGEWWSGAVKVNDDRSKIVPMIKRYARRYTREMGFVMGGKSMKDYDLLIRVFLCPNKGNALAYAGPFVRHPDTQRPITGTVCILPYGDSNFKKAKDSVNRAVGTVIHEFGHVISFISWERYHKSCLKMDRSINKFKWTCEKVLEVAKKHYGCNTLDGVPLQNNNGQLGGHWSETFLSNELMTPTTGSDAEVVSPMTLALCEDTKWYKANWSYTENYIYGKGKGCDFFGKSCKKPICEEGTRGFVTSDYTGVGYCTTDDRGCAKEVKYANRNCKNATGWSSRDLKYGASYGGNCAVMSGEFKRSEGYYTYTGTKASLQADCSNSNNSYVVTFKNFDNGKDKKVTCTKEESLSFKASGKDSTLNCIDPRKFCAKRFGNKKELCDDSCGQNGRCQNKKYNRRRLTTRALGACPNTETPTKISKVTTKSGVTTVTATPFGTDAFGGQWGCWCYSNGKVSKACPDLSEDKDGEY